MSNAAADLQKTIADINLEELPVSTLERCAPRKEQAKIARKIFKDLGLKGIRVTTPRYSRAQSVDVTIPGLPRNPEGLHYDDYDCTIDPNAKANHAARLKMEKIIDAIFPNHRDKSDYTTDYYNYRWSLDTAC